MLRKNLLTYLLVVFILSTSILCPLSPASADGMICSLSVPIITQYGYPKACWACCGASAVNYAKGLNISLTTFALHAGSSPINSGSFSTVQSGLFYYSLSYSYHSSSVSASSIKSSLQNGRSLIAGWDYYKPSGALSGAHMVLICGIDYGSTVKTIQFMDPQYSTYQYKDYSLFRHEGNRTWTKTLSNIYYPGS